MGLVLLSPLCIPMQVVSVRHRTMLFKGTSHAEDLACEIQSSIRERGKIGFGWLMADVCLFKLSCC